MKPINQVLIKRNNKRLLLTKCESEKGIVWNINTKVLEKGTRTIHNTTLTLTNESLNNLILGVVSLGMNNVVGEPVHFKYRGNITIEQVAKSFTLISYK